MDAKGLLSATRRWALLGSLAILLLPNEVDAKRRDRKAAVDAARRPTQGLIRLRRMTIGDHNHFMGVLGPSGRYLYYVTDEFNTYDLFVQSPVTAPGEPLFEAFGDIVWPAVSPDGKELAYIRYETEARGDACRRRIRSNGKAKNDREDCHETDDADLQIYWRNDGRLGILLREELHGDHVLLDGAFDRDPVRREANVVGFALSPDDRWVAYVPLARAREEIGVSFSNELSKEGIRIRRAVPDAPEVAFSPKLPGVSAYPTFSTDGNYLYFSQFLNDTNRDGVIDGDDNGVLFRVSFRGDVDPPGLGRPVQLTNARWNCHYPSVRETSMALTCGIDGNLHIYLLPPTGTVPAEWDQQQIMAHAARVTNPWNELLLRQHLLVNADDDEARAEQLKAMAQLHLKLSEYEATVYYADQRRALLKSVGVDDSWARLTKIYAQHRRADQGLARGRMSETYIEQSTEAANAAAALDPFGSPDVAAHRRLVLGRILSDSGDKSAAAQEFASVELAGVKDENVVDFAYDQFSYFYALLADHETRLARLREVALHPASSVNQSLRHSKGFIDLVRRGRPMNERRDCLVEARADVPDDSRLALALDLEIALFGLTAENASAVEEEFVRLYARTSNPHVRRYLVLSALRAAQREGVESFQYSLLERWVESVERSDPEQQTTSRLYELAVMERAYSAFSVGDYETAASYFDRARRATGSPAGHAGWMESQFRLGRKENDIEADYRKFFRNEGDGVDVFDGPGTREFVAAYFLARDLGRIESNDALTKRVDRVRELLESAVEQDPYQAVVHLLLAHALHHRAIRLGSRDDMSLAVRHYLLADDLAGRRRPRVRMSTHSGTALAQAELGNHRRALKDYEARLELPFTSSAQELGILLGYARSLFHVDKKPAAIRTLRRALEMIENDDELEPYEPLVLDRLALYELDAGRIDDSRATHIELRESLRSHPAADTPINEVKARARLSAAHLATHQPEPGLRFAREGRAELAAADPLRPPDIDRRVRPVTHEFIYDETQLDLLLAGLEATAAERLDDRTAAREALIARGTLLDEEYQATEVDELLLELAHTCLRLAYLASREGDLSQTQRELEDGLGYADQHRVSTGTEVSEAGFHLLRAYADLHFDGGVPLTKLNRKLEADLMRYYAFLSKVRNPEWETERVRLEIYLARLRMEP
jgi:tetratricopeptide (TPR) repeat protein